MTDNLAPHNSFKAEPPLPNGASSFAAHVWGFFAGIISGMAFVQIFAGGLLGLLLAYVCLLPLYLTGLAGGRTAAVTAAVFGIIAVFLQTLSGGGVTPALLYALLFAVPAMVHSRVALIKIADNFVPSGVILLTMLTLGVVLLLAAALGFTLADASISAATTTVAESYAALMRDSNPNLSAEEITQAQTVLVEILPGLVALSWLIIHGLNFCIAQWLAGEMKKAQRAAPALSALALPRYLAGLAVITALGGAYTTGNTGIVLGALGMLLGAGFTLVGLAIGHALLLHGMARRGWTSWQQTLLLFFYYVVFLGLQLPLLLALLLGLLDPWLHFRRKLIKATV